MLEAWSETDVDLVKMAANPSKFRLQEANAFIEAMIAIQREAEQDAAKVKGAPYTLPVRRLDDVRAAKQLDLTYQRG